MALEMPFTDATGTEHSPAHWRLVQLNIGAADRTIALTFYAYRSLADFAAGRRPLPGAAKRYTIEGAAFLAVAFAPTLPGTRYDDLAHAAEAHALATLDTPTGEVDGDGDPVMVSFFHAATQV